MKILLKVCLFGAALALIGCGGAERSANNSAAKTYEFKGTVVSVDRMAKTARIDHAEVPGLMPAMTMDFPIHEDWVWGELVPGVSISAELVEDKAAKDPFYLRNIVISAAPVTGQSDLPEKTPEQIGKAVPENTLTDQDGKQFKLGDLKGKAVAITFIYADCPLPEFCIKMSKQFSDITKQVLADAALKDKVRLVSVSFDPARDTPEKLRRYGLGYLGDTGAEGFSVWKLATGNDKDIKAIADFFGLRYEPNAEDAKQIDHSLVTAIVGPDGKVQKLYSGGRWTPDQLLSDLKAAAAN